MTNAERLDRIESKIDSLSDAVVAIARAEEKLEGLSELTAELHRKLSDLDDRLRAVETQARDSQNKLKIINKIFWIAISALVTGGIAMTLFGSGVSMF